MTILMTGGDPIPIRDDWEDTPCCPKCDCEMDWADCHMIDCEDGEYDMSEEDPVNYGPGSYAKCSECNGHGGWWYCPNKACPSEEQRSDQP